MTSSFTWTDNPMLSGLSNCDPDIVNENLMYLKGNNVSRYFDNISYDKDTVVFDTATDILELYISLEDENQGNPLTDTNFWKLIGTGGGGGGGTWGSITGTLSNQTDLQEALDSKSGVVFRNWQ